MKIFCIIPALNEENKIGPVIESVKKTIENIVVVDDGSVDNTAKVAREKGAVVLSHIINRGQGAALETGNEYALKNGAEAVVHFDADGQFLSEEISSLLEPVLKDEADVALGSRFMSKKSNMPFFKKNIIMPMAHLVNRFILGIKINLTDPQCGFRVLSKKALQQIKIEQRGMAHCSEIIAQIFENKLRVKEVPITVIYSKFGQSIFKETRGGGGVRIVKDTIIAKLVK